MKLLSVLLTFLYIYYIRNSSKSQNLIIKEGTAAWYFHYRTRIAAARSGLYSGHRYRRLWSEWQESNLPKLVPKTSAQPIGHTPIIGANDK